MTQNSSPSAPFSKEELSAIEALKDQENGLVVLYRRGKKSSGQYWPLWINTDFEEKTGYSLVQLQNIKAEFIRVDGEESHLNILLNQLDEFAGTASIYSRVIGHIRANIHFETLPDLSEDYHYKTLLISDAIELDRKLGKQFEDFEKKVQPVDSFLLTETQMRAAIASAKLAVWDWSVATNEVRYSTECYTMLGYEPTDFPSEFAPWVALVKEAHRESTRKIALDAIHGTTNTYQANLQMRCKDGSWKWIRTSAVILERDAETGIATRITGSHLDIDEDFRRQEAIQKALRSAEQAREAKERFLAVMSHEIRTPINGVLGMLDFLMDTKMTDVQLEYLTIARQSSQNLLTILNNTLDYSKLEAGSFDLESIDFDVRDLIENSVLLFKAKAHEKDLYLKIAIDPSIPKYITADAAKLRQIILNLVGNAIKFTEEGGITVALGYPESHTNTGGKSYALLSVSDTGIGVSKDAQKSIFESFTQADASTSRRFGGTGLGLSITKKLADLMGGGISVDGEEGIGTCFTVTLPILKADAPVEDKKQAFNHSAITYHTKLGGVLIVEDNPINMKISEKLLALAGVNSHKALDGVEAVKLASEQAFDIILMDIQMPNMDGIEATRAIRHQAGPNKDTPIIALTADAMAGDRERYFSAGMNGYITKPVERHHFYAELARFLPYSEKQGEDTPENIGEKTGETPAAAKKSAAEKSREERKAAPRLETKTNPVQNKASEDTTQSGFNALSNLLDDL